MTGVGAGTLGVWCTTDGMDARRAVAFAQEIGQLGYSALWLPETIGRDPFAHIAHLAAHETELTYATGIASIHHRHPAAMAQAARTVHEQCDRFVLGVGVSHAPFVEGLRKVTYGKPLGAMSTYLDAMDAAPYLAPGGMPPRVLAALGPKMLALAAERADGALTYWPTPGHTATARAVLGPDKLLCVEQKVVLTDDIELGRSTARRALKMYDGLPNYRNHWLRIGFEAAQIDARSDEFVDALVVIGGPEVIARRIEEHRRQGADHVCIQALTPSAPFDVDVAALARLAREMQVNP